MKRIRLFNCFKVLECSRNSYIPAGIFYDEFKDLFTERGLKLIHESGALYHALSHLIYNGLNMTKIESRPLTGRNWEYRFFLDFEGNMQDSAVKNALRGLREETRNMKVLGNY